MNTYMQELKILFAIIAPLQKKNSGVNLMKAKEGGIFSMGEEAK